jgi:hypothetical protein
MVQDSFEEPHLMDAKFSRHALARKNVDVNCRYFNVNIIHIQACQSSEPVKAQTSFNLRRDSPLAAAR